MSLFVLSCSLNKRVAQTEISVQGNMSEQLKFYTSWFCPFAQRVAIALELQRLKYTSIEVRLNRKPFLLFGALFRSIRIISQKNGCKYRQEALCPSFIITEMPFGSRRFALSTCMTRLEAKVPLLEGRQSSDTRNYYPMVGYMFSKADANTSDAHARARHRMAGDLIVKEFTPAFYSILLKQNKDGRNDQILRLLEALE